ncbi:hypothetical protein [Hydrogenophaga sp. OTU3427]|uniref:hypothetical protein n=1 Tax=Hydrogenophaga sp. OTU3427 TaxID=3043856 RepID=UPI00313AB5BF
MRAFIPAVLFALAIAGVWIYLRRRSRKAPESSALRTMHQRIIGGAIILYGLYLATLTGTVTKLVIPGLGALGGGAAAGAGVGLLTALAIGTVGVVTGGAGFAVGAGYMALIGGGLGLTGSLVGGIGLKTLAVPLVTPWFWAPLLVLGLYVFLGASKRNAIKQQQNLEQLQLSEANKSQGPGNSMKIQAP